MGGETAHALVIGPREITDTGPFDLDHARAEISQLPRAEGGGDGVLKGDDLDSVQGTHRVLHFRRTGAGRAGALPHRIGSDWLRSVLPGTAGSRGTCARRHTRW